MIDLGAAEVIIVARGMWKYHFFSLQEDEMPFPFNKRRLAHILLALND